MDPLLSPRAWEAHTLFGADLLPLPPALTLEDLLEEEQDCDADAGEESNPEREQACSSEEEPVSNIEAEMASDSEGEEDLDTPFNRQCAKETPFYRQCANCLFDLGVGCNLESERGDALDLDLAPSPCKVSFNMPVHVLKLDACVLACLYASSVMSCADCCQAFKLLVWYAFTLVWHAFILTWQYITFLHLVGCLQAFGERWYLLYHMWHSTLCSPLCPPLRPSTSTNLHCWKGGDALVNRGAP